MSALKSPQISLEKCRLPKSLQAVRLEQFYPAVILFDGLKLIVYFGFITEANS